MTDATPRPDQVCPWTLLGVSPEDDPVTIRAAWRALVRSYHPDLARTDREAANRRLAEINAAFDAVCDQDAARLRMDSARKAARRQRAEALRRAEAAEQAQREAARKAETAREAPAAPPPGPRPARWSPADRLAARGARLAFESARRVFEAAPAPRTPAFYL